MTARYPTDLVVTAEDFRRSAWKEAVNSAERGGYPAMWTALAKSAGAAMETGDQPRGKVLWLLADACSMMLKPESLNEPFRPIVVMGDHRSAVPDDFSDDDIRFFREIVAEIDEDWLRARTADLSWLRSKPRDPELARAAIDAYRRVPLDSTTWAGGAGACWKRATALASLLRDGAGDRLMEMVTAMLGKLRAATTADGYFALVLADHLVEQRLVSKDELAKIAEHLETLGKEFRQAAEHHRAHDYLERAAALFERADDRERSCACLVALAEACVAEALGSPSGFAAASLYEKAIQTCRRIPRSLREQHAVDKRVAKLHRSLTEAVERSLDELGVVESGPIDISEMVRAARASVQGKTTEEALRAFTLRHHISEKMVRDAAVEAVRKHPLSHLFPMTAVSSDGRVIAKSPGMPLTETPGVDDEPAIRTEMLRHYDTLVQLTVQGSIVPALEALLLEHRLLEDDFGAVAARSPIVPPERARLFGKGLFAGYERDFATAIHLLAPQVEAMVRYHLKAAGARTATLDQQGIETEKGLSALVEMAETRQVFGPDLSFEIGALFCDPRGPNLRNQVAHGLLSSAEARSIYVVYAWWLCLRVVFIPFWNAHRQNKSVPDPEPLA